MAPNPSRFLKDVYPEFPDDDTMKVVELQAEGVSYPGYGDRHTLLQWLNGTNDGNDVTQIIQLTGMVGNYTYYTPLAKKRGINSSINNAVFPLGKFTRAQRDRILALADGVAFEKTSTVNSCRTWTRDLLEAMVKEGLLSRSTFDEIDEKVPLLKRQPEA